MALNTRVAVTERDRWLSPHSTSEGHNEQKAVTLQPMACVHTRLQHNAHPLKEGTAHRLCKKRSTHLILRNLNCDENTDFKDLTAKEVKEEIFITLAHLSWGQRPLGPEDVRVRPGVLPPWPVQGRLVFTSRLGSTEVLTEEAGALGGLAGLPVSRGDSEGAAPEVGR